MEGKKIFTLIFICGTWNGYVPFDLRLEDYCITAAVFEMQVYDIAFNDANIRLLCILVVHFFNLVFECYLLLFFWVVIAQPFANLLLVFTAGKLPKHNNVSWRGNSCLQDGKSDDSTMFKNLVGGYYDAGDAIKFNFPQSFALTMLSWSVIEYSAKYEAAGELTHVKDIIKWGTDYLLKTFNSSADTIDRIAAQVTIIYFALCKCVDYNFLN